jgi:uncharacterized protein (TIGR02996 family)
MSDEAGFLKAIVDQPAERSTRLVYADWLDEHDRPREAEFLRLQLQAVELNTRLLELAGHLDPKWLVAVGSVRTEPQWLKLRAGCSIVLREFRQWNFYMGLMAGAPTSQMNREWVERLVRDERQRRDQEPYLIQPTERLMTSDEGDPWPEPRGLLPRIACVGRFESFDAAKDKARDASELTIVWFQDEFALPIDPGVREHVRAIDWERHAHDFDW